MAQKDIKKLVYEYITTPGFYSSKVASLLGVKRPYVTRIIKGLEAAGYIVCINKKGKPKFYEKTKKPFSLETGAKLTTLLHKKVNRLQGSCEYAKFQSAIQVQKTQVKFHVIASVDVGAKWDKQYKLKNGVEVSQYVHPFKNLGNVVIQRYKSKNKDIVLFSLPRLLVPKEELKDQKEVEQFLIDIAMRVSPLFQKKFGIRLSLPEIANKPDFAVPVKEPALADIAKKYTFKVGDVTLDSSPPHNIPELESKNPIHVINYLESIQKIGQIETINRDSIQRINELENRLQTVFGVLKEFQNKIIEIVDKIVELDKHLEILPELNKKLAEVEKLNEQIKKLNETFEKNNKPDEYKDVV